MKILRIIYDFADESVQTEGLSPGPYDLTISQGKNPNNTLYVLTGNLNGRNLLKRRFHYTLGEGNIHVYNLPRAIWRFGPFLSTSIAVLPYYFYFRFVKKIDIVHNHQQMGVWFLVYKALFGWIDKNPVVHTNHGSIKGREQKAINNGEKLDFWTKNFEYLIWKFNDYLSTKVADLLIAVSVGVKEEMEEFYAPKTPIIIVENSVSLDRFAKGGEAADLGFSPSDKVLLNLGRLSKRKNIDLIIRAMQYLPNEYKLSLIGPWDAEFRENVAEPLIQELNLENRVKYLGMVSNFIAHKYYRTADFFVLPSEHEGLPKAVVEALACGNKVLASGFKMGQEIPNLFYLSDLDPKTIAKSIEDANARENAYDQTRKILEDHYSWDSRAEELDEIYEKLLG